MVYFAVDFINFSDFIVWWGLISIAQYFVHQKYRRAQWSFLFELLLISGHFLSVWVGYVIIWIGARESEHYPFTASFLLFYFLRLWNYVTVFVLSQLCGDSYLLEKRIHLPLETVIISEMKNGFFDGLFTGMCVSYLGVDAWGADDSPTPSFFEAFPYVILALPIHDFIYWFFHGYLLHGPLWFTHRGHHKIHRPTIDSGRDFDILDWFVEGSSTVVLFHIAHATFLKDINMSWRWFMCFAISQGFSVTYFHHLGMHSIPDPCSFFMPWTEFITKELFGKGGCLEPHEYHHNYLNVDFGVYGFVDNLFGTAKIMKMKKAS